jgi:hypothetical protein
MKTIVPILFLLAGIIAGCSNEMAFDREKWLVVDDLMYPYRERMVADLLKRYPLKGLTYSQVVDLLGKPEGGEPLYPFYTIRVEYGTNIDPVYVKNLELSLDASAKVVECGVREYKPQ